MDQESPDCPHLCLRQRAAREQRKGKALRGLPPRENCSALQRSKQGLERVTALRGRGDSSAPAPAGSSQRQAPELCSGSLYVAAFRYISGEEIPLVPVTSHHKTPLSSSSASPRQERARGKKTEQENMPLVHLRSCVRSGGSAAGRPSKRCPPSHKLDLNVYLKTEEGGFLASTLHGPHGFCPRSRFPSLQEPTGRS